MAASNRVSQFLHVSPRYTPGSPAMVDEATGQRLAVDELNAYAWYLRGRHGDEDAERARTAGVAGIVERRTERQRPHRWEVEDIITGETFTRPIDKVGR